LKGYRENVACVAISNDNKLIVSCSENCTVRAWNIEEKREIAF